MLGVDSQYISFEMIFRQIPLPQKLICITCWWCENASHGITVRQGRWHEAGGKNAGETVFITLDILVLRKKVSFWWGKEHTTCGWWNSAWRTLKSRSKGFSAHVTRLMVRKEASTVFRAAIPLSPLRPKIGLSKFPPGENRESAGESSMLEYPSIWKILQRTLFSSFVFE